MYKYADDILLLLSRPIIGNSVAVIKSEWDNIFTWAEKHELGINMNKTEHLLIIRIFIILGLL